MKNIKALTIFCLTALITLTGCNKNLANDNELKDALNSNKSESAKELEKNSQQNNTENIHLYYEISGDKRSSITVDADVKSEDLSKLKIYQINKHGMDDEYIKGLADKVFDNGTYEYQKPPYACSLEELDVMRSWIDNIMSMYEKPFMCPKPLVDDLRMCVEAKENYSQDHEQIIPEGQYYFMVPITDDDLTQQGINDMKLCRFIGRRDGKDWILSSIHIGSYQKVVLYPYFQNEAICSIEDKDDSNLNIDTLCKIKKEDGETSAKECLNDLGYGEYELIDITKTFSKNTEEEAIMNGYIYTYARAFDGINTAYLERFNPEVNTVDRTNTPQEYVSIYVDSFGVEQIDFAAHYELGDVVMSEPALLDFKKIDEVAQKQFKECMAVNQEQELNIVVDRIEMKYMAVVDSNSKYSFIPVWIYHLNYAYYGSERCTTDLCINAMDGTIINKDVSIGWAYYMAEMMGMTGQ